MSRRGGHIQPQANTNSVERAFRKSPKMINTAQYLALQNAGFFKSSDASERAQIWEDNADAFDLPDLDVCEERYALEAEEKNARKAASAEKKLSKKLTGGAETAPIDVRGPGVYIVTAAQNNTDACPKFLGALKVLAREYAATIIAGRTPYNKSMFVQPETEDFYVGEVRDYLATGTVDLGGVYFLADAAVIPTAKHPLSGFEGASPAGVDLIVPASKIALKCVAAMKGDRVKRMFSTGTLTLPNYINRKAGSVAITEHNMGALFVDTTGESPIVMQIELMQGENGFYFEGDYFTAEGFTSGHKAAAFQPGDLHFEKADEGNLIKVLDALASYKPDHVLMHDVLDFSSRNHHNIKDPTFLFEQHVKGNTVEGDLKAVAKGLDRFFAMARNANPNAQLHIVESNHDLAINTWLKNADFKADQENALTYLTCMKAWYENIKAKNPKYFNMLAFAYSRIGKGKNKEEIKFHEVDESLVIAGVQMGCHGHTGVNGSRGSPVGLRSLGVAMNTGHTHTPGITGKVYTAGVSASLEMGYNVGASSWCIASTVTWPNGQRQIIFHS